MSDDLDQAKDQFIRQAIQDLQDHDSNLTFREAWDIVQFWNPKWFSPRDSEQAMREDS
jgi:hypothetical protein